MKLEFKTNIKCSGCVAAVTPHLNSAETVEKWQVDTENPEKILTVEGDQVNEKQVVEAVTKAGYQISRK